MYQDDQVDKKLKNVHGCFKFKEKLAISVNKQSASKKFVV